MRMQFSAPWTQVKAVLPSTSALVFLVGLAIWGHISHWKFAHDDVAADAHGTGAAAPAPLTGTAPHSEATLANEGPLAHDDLEAVDNAAARIRFPSAEAVRKSDVQTSPVEQRAINEEIVANGVISYDQTRVAQLGARVPGTVWRIEKLLGEPIKKGDVLAIIEAVDVGKSKADLLQAVVDHQLKKSIAERLASKQSFVPERQLYEAQAEARAAFIRMVNAQQTLVNLGLPIRVQDLQGVPDEELAQRVQFLGMPESIKRTLDPATTTVSLVPLVAPFDGVVIGNEISLGEIVSPSARQFEVADISRMWIRMDVRKEDATQLKLGQEVKFKTDSAATEVTSTINWISSEIDEKTRTVPVRAEVSNPRVPGDESSGRIRRLLLANSFGTGRIRVREVPTAVVVPQDAIQWEGHHWVVFVQVDDTTFEARHVEIGITLQGMVEVRSGVVAGDTIATTGSHLLKSEIVRSRLAASP